MRAIETPDKNPHIHMALSGIDIAKLPRWPYGRVDFVPVDDRDHHTYGGYLREETHIKQGHKGKYNTAKAKVCYSRSRNLTVPEPEYKIIYNDHWADEPKDAKGLLCCPGHPEQLGGRSHRVQVPVLCALPDLKEPTAPAVLGGRQ